MGVPPEFHEDGAPEYPDLPDEFNRNAPVVESTEVKRRKHTVLLYLAAAGLITVGFFVPRSDRTAVEAQAQSTATAAVSTTAEPTEVPTLTPAATPAPTAAPTPVPTETPKVTPIPTPGVNVTYYRMSQVYYATLILSMPEQLSSVSFRLMAPGVEEPAFALSLTPEQIAGRVYQLRAENRDEGFDANGYLADHWDVFGTMDREPDLSMELTYTVTGDAGEETHTETFAPAEELWVDWGFDSEDDVGGIAEWMYGKVYPNCFVVRLWESTDPDQQLEVGSDEDSLVSGGVLFSVSIDGREIPAEGSTVDMLMYKKFADDDTIYYDYVLVVPIPDDFPEHGTARLTLTRMLRYSKAIRIREKTVEY